MRMKLLLNLLVMGLCTVQALALSNLDITNVNLIGSRVYVTAQTDESGLPLSAFSATDDGNPVTLQLDCFEAQDLFVDIVFVIDVSRSMEDNIRAVANQIGAFVTELEGAHPEFDVRFGLITYGQGSNPNSAEACPNALYYGGPRNRTHDGLVHADDLIAQLNAIACPGQEPPNCLQGGNEPGYHATQCANNSTPWRASSIKRVVLVSDENNDWANGSGAGCDNDPIPFVALADLINELNANGVDFYGWVNPIVVCDGHDNGDGIAPENLPCGVLDDEGCTSGMSDYNPLAVGTGGVTVPIQNSAEELFDALALPFLTTYTVCYDLICCVPGIPHEVCVTATHNAETADDCAFYTPTVANCPESFPPTIFCDPTNSPYFVPGDPYTGCFVATDADGIDHVDIAYQTGICAGVVEATHVGGDRYCYTISGACTDGAAVINLDATAYDICGASSGAECPALPPQDLTCYDLGDLPNPPYPTFPANAGGPAHAESDIAWLGSSVDCEEVCCDDGGGEDNGFTPDCEAQGGWADCEEHTLVVTVSTGLDYAGQNLYLGIWYDWNGNGSFNDGWTCADLGYTEFLGNHLVAPGVNGVNVGPLANASGGYVNLRFRLSTAPFGSGDYIGSRPDGEVEDYSFYCPPDQECCAICVVNPPLTMGSDIAPIFPDDMRVVAYVRDGHLHLSWNAVEDAAYYEVYRGGANGDFTTMHVVATVPGIDNFWMEPLSIGSLPAMRVYQVQPYVQQLKTGRDVDDRGKWEFNEGAGDILHDFSGYDRHGDLWDDCPPTWGFETIETCDIGFASFHGVHPDGCAEHIRVANDDVFYEDRFQIWACIRIFDQPTIQSGPYYIMSNNSFDINGGGFALRLDPGWFWVNGVREYHNRVTIMVWNSELNGGEGGWHTLQSPPPDPATPDRYSVPLNRWSTVCAIVDGNNSMLIIDGQVVAVGDIEYHSENNNAPLIIGAGYRHSTYPIEYPFYGDIDCIRFTTITDN